MDADCWDFVETSYLKDRLICFTRAGKDRILLTLLDVQQFQIEVIDWNV